MSSELLSSEIEDFQARLLAGTWTRRDVVRLIEINQLLQEELGQSKKDAKAWAESCDRFADRNRSLEEQLEALRTASQEALDVADRSGLTDATFWVRDLRSVLGSNPASEPRP